MPATGEPSSRRATQGLLRAGCWFVTHNLRVDCIGLDQIPPTGPAILAVRHFHHLWDGCTLMQQIPRPVHFLVATDWEAVRPKRKVVDCFCRGAGWPVVLRPEGIAHNLEHRARPKARVIEEADIRRHLVRAMHELLALLDSGRLVAIFPEGWANIDPGYTPKQDERTFLPFRPGVIRLAEMAARQAQLDVPIIPVGLEYRHGKPWHVTMRVGAPLHHTDPANRKSISELIEDQVRMLSGFPPVDRLCPTCPDLAPVVVDEDPVGEPR